jgi:hypothetical protein
MNLVVKNTRSRTTNGGYYAIKGFTYQFDKTILQILENPNENVQIEQIQDVGLQNYYIQIKYKESQTYSPSKIKMAVHQLLACFQLNKSNRFLLYCYFKNRSPETKKLSSNELDSILSDRKNEFSESIKNEFLKKFTIEFSEDYEKQFKSVIKKINISFKLNSDELAILNHSIIRSKLIDIATLTKSKSRIVNFRYLQDLLTQGEKVIFNYAYLRYLDKSKYLNFLHRDFFTHKKLNIRDFERLFFIEIDNKIKDSDLLKIIDSIQAKYFKKHTSPAPYICMRSVDTDRFSTVKQMLYSKDLPFVDGTHFDGDIFRINDLLASVHDNNSNATFKLFLSGNLDLVLSKIKFDEIYSFYTFNRVEINSKYNIKEFYIEQTSDIIKIIY